MTGLAETEHIVRGLEAGGVDYVTKPIAIEKCWRAFASTSPMRG